MVMPFGLKNAGATDQRDMNIVFHDLISDFIQVYINDIVIKSRAKDSHLINLRKAFEGIRKHGSKMNPLKCAFIISVEEFLRLIAD